LTEPFYLSRTDYRQSTNADLYQLYNLAVKKSEAMDKEVAAAERSESPSERNKVWEPKTDADNLWLMKLIGVQGVPDDFLEQQAKKKGQ